MVPKGRRRQAARLHARSASPYLQAGVTLVKSGQGFAIWWWDLSRVQALLQASGSISLLKLMPETAAQPAAPGWRIVKLGHGYEAQLWRSGYLVASAWRQTRFDAESWAAFTRVQRGEAAPPVTPPPAETLPIADDSAAFALSTQEMSRADLARLGAASLGAFTLALSLFWLGQGASLGNSAAKLEAESARIRATTPSASVLGQSQADLRRLRSFRETESRTGPLTAAGAAIGVLALYHLTPSAMKIDEGGVTATLPYSAVNRAADLVEEFEKSGYFYDVEPRTDPANQTITFEMKTIGAAPPLSAGG